MKTMLEFMLERERDILKGGVGYDREVLGKRNREKRDLDCHKVAIQQAQADKSNPFMFNQVMSFLRGGLAYVEDYSLRWGIYKAQTQLGIALGKDEKVDIAVPFKRTIPCS